MRKPYASLDEVKNYLNISTEDNDSTLNIFRESSSSIIDKYVGQPFEIEYGIASNFLNVKDRDVFILERWPVVGISTIESGVDYQLRSDAGIIFLDTPFTGDFALSYSAGQQPPDQVKVACLELSYLSFTRRKTMGINQMSMGDFQFSIRKVEQETSDILHTLDDFRDTRIVHRNFVNELF